MEYSVTWIFRNQHEWRSTFSNTDQRSNFINRVGLVTHPDIIRVYISDPDGSVTDLKRVAEIQHN